MIIETASLLNLLSKEVYSPVYTNKGNKTCGFKNVQIHVEPRFLNPCIRRSNIAVDIILTFTGVRDWKMHHWAVNTTCHLLPRLYSLQAVTRHFSGREVCLSDSNVMTSSTRKVQVVALICTCLLLLLLVIIWPISFSDVEYYEVCEEVATEFAKGCQWGGSFNGGKQSNMCSCHSYNPITVDIRDLKIRRRRRQRGRQKSRGLNIQNNNFARPSRFFTHFFAVTARLRRENA